MGKGKTNGNSQISIYYFRLVNVLLKYHLEPQSTMKCSGLDCSPVVMGQIEASV